MPLGSPANSPPTRRVMHRSAFSLFVFAAIALAAAPLFAASGDLAPPVWPVEVPPALPAANGLQANVPLPPGEVEEVAVLTALGEALPRQTSDCTAERAAQVAEAAHALDDWANDWYWENFPESAQEILEMTSVLVVTKTQVDEELQTLLTLRGDFASEGDSPELRESMRQYLAMTSCMIDLSGRLRYLLRDAIDETTYANETNEAGLNELLALLREHRVGIGAVVLAEWLFDPPVATGLEPFSFEMKHKILRLIAESQEVDALGQVADFVQDEDTPPSLVLAAAQVIHDIGLPQDPGPGQDPTLPTPLITAEALANVLADVDISEFTQTEMAQLEELTKWLAERRIAGVTGEVYHYGGMELRPGDWLLMRNPSPYNLFTDLSPGLYTHVGVVAAVTDDEGIRRFVIVDLPERGARMPLTNVDTYLRRTLNYAFLRHPDPAVGARMGEVAASVIGNETQFDLNFRGDRVEALRGQPLEGQLIHTYCAGLLLLCAQETTAPREEFFPFEEFASAGNTSDNLATLGLEIGEKFVSPTGSLFSEQLEIVGRRESMYEPGRQVQEAAYDYFARAMREEVLTPNPDAYQALREKLAEVSQSNAWLARALARANNVNEQMDLESAAKTAAVVETLDEIAEGCMGEFHRARQSIMAGPYEELEAAGVNEQDLAVVRELREKHSELFVAWEAGEVTPRDVREQLVEFYCQHGGEMLDERFFSEPEADLAE